MTDVRIISESLGGSPLSVLLQRGDAPAQWTAVAPQSAESWAACVSKRAGERDWSARWDALWPAIEPSGAAAERLERVRRTGGIVVTTGQQPGLFGGPVYTWSKAMGALAFADALERATGVATAVVFWAATDDADFAEAAYTVLAGPGGAEKIHSEHAPPSGTPMTLAPLGDMSTQLERLRSNAASAADARPLRAVESAYAKSDATVGSAYVALMREMLAPLGIPVLDASHAAVRSASDAILRDALRSAKNIEEALNKRTQEIRAAYLDPQVVDVGGLSLVFAREGSIKRRLSIAESSAFANDANAWLTPNVLLRPIVEREILPTVAYLGGPGELAYFAQSSAVADALGVARPLGLPRWSCTFVEPHVERILSALGVTPDALSRPDELEGIVARRTMSEPSAKTFAELRRTIENVPASLSAEADPLGLEKAVQGATQSLLHRVERLERRIVAGIKRREHALLRDVGTVRGALYPLRTRQERALNLVPTLSRHGMELLGEMCAAAGPHAARLIGGTSPS